MQSSLSLASQNGSPYLEVSGIGYRYCQTHAFYQSGRSTSLLSIAGYTSLIVTRPFPPELEGGEAPHTYTPPYTEMPRKYTNLSPNLLYTEVLTGHTHTLLLACHSYRLTIPSFGFLTMERYPRRTISLSPAAIMSDNV